MRDRKQKSSVSLLADEPKSFLRLFMRVHTASRPRTQSVRTYTHEEVSEREREREERERERERGRCALYTHTGERKRAAWKGVND